MNVFGLFSIPGPLWLLGAPIAAGVLVYVYRRRGSGTRVLVASNLLLQRLPQELKSRSSFLPPPRFFFELLLCLLLVLALAGIRSEQPTKNVAVLIDNSFHTRATFANETRFRRIVDKARASITSLSKDTTVTIFKTAPVPTQVGEAFLSTTEAWKKVEEIESVESGGEIQDASEFISKQEKFESLYIFSDLLPAPDYKPQKSVYYFPLASIAPENNIAIREAKWLAENSQRPFGSITAVLTAFSIVDTTAAVRLECLQKGRLLPAGGKEVLLLAGTSAEVSFTRIPGNAKACRITASVVNETTNTDVLKGDNQFWVVKDVSSNAILLVSDFSTAELGLDKLNQYTFEHQDPVQYLAARDASSQYRLTLLHRVPVPRRPRNNSLIIAPNEALPFLKTAQAESARLARWNTAHPIVRYVNFSSMQLSVAQSFEPSLSLYPVVHANKGALLLAGENSERRTVISGIELLPFSGKEQPTLSILLLNILKWTLESNENATSIVPFERLELEDGQAVSYFTETGEGTLIEQNNAIAIPDRSGLIFRSGANENSLIAVARFDPQESDLRTPRTFSQPDFVSTVAAPTEDSLSYWLLLCITLVLAIDMFVLTGLSFFREARA